ncbi:hypothetical protein CPT_Mater47 [Bacillus phage Mater]|uniref:Uncharacterized protein n=1 Tax=Bacillus phage Mater TaxID=1540090 RepID=A0A0A0RNI2_9CAUD|nr:hypothetical protein CPT_Mater47 [Bacillus phage Mater]AIW03204.1 hypothetical protein CPT_Mater47 [Bacillus phage Mater]
MQKEIELSVSEPQVRRIASQLTLWSIAATQAIEKQDKYGWEISIKSIKSMTYTLSEINFELVNMVQEKVRENLIEKLGSEEAFEANNEKWSEWQHKLRKERQEEI